MRAATEGNLPPIMPQGNLVEVLGREVRRGSPGELMVESLPFRPQQPPCKTNKGMSHEAADAAALTHLLTYLLSTAPPPRLQFSATMTGPTPYSSYMVKSSFSIFSFLRTLLWLSIQRGV